MRPVPAPSSPTFGERASHILRHMKSLAHLSPRKGARPRPRSLHHQPSCPSPLRPALPSSVSAHSHLGARAPSAGLRLRSPPPAAECPNLSSPPPPSTSAAAVPWIYVTASPDPSQPLQPVARRERVQPFRGVDVPAGDWLAHARMERFTDAPDAGAQQEFLVDEPPCAYSSVADRLREFKLLAEDLKATFPWGDGESVDADGAEEGLIVELEEVAQQVRVLTAATRLFHPDVCLPVSDAPG
ncbi:hypothetical protein FA95DRAFT_1603215 [Auriscalpium vulgare]|uniref:Uncharacterized protein n=1 Tax=Auriscalpium vulgare TaxID=40419 RepID=A0ACB8S3K8_9AGAM|nr:hypothetical protein FA95DRAFT_1603215 [Auriscalpium vulgare]